MSWLLQRVDDRLIHGQVVVAWGQHLHPRRIWVVDDSCAANDWERELLQGAAPDHDVQVLTVAEAAEAYADEDVASGGSFLLVRDLDTALALVEAGADVRSYNVGGLHYAPGKDKINEYIYMDEHDRRTAQALLARGVTLEAQDVPASRPLPLTSLDTRLMAP